MNGHFLIKKATLSDIDDVVRMRLSLQQHMHKHNPHLWQMSEKKVSSLPTFYRQAIDDRAALLLIVQEDESKNIVGMALGRIFLHDEYEPKKSGRIDDVWIELNCRKKGLCKKLVSELLEFFKLNNADSIILEYSNGNVEAKAIWERLGFKPLLITATASLSDLECISKVNYI